MAAVLDNEELLAAHVLQQVPVWFEEWEQSLSRFRIDSGLCRLNNTAGWAFRAEDTLWEVVKVALHAAKWTDGLVNPVVLQSLERIGYDRSFTEIQQSWPTLRPPYVFVLEEEYLPGIHTWREILLDERTHEITLPHETRIDLGGVAKGWAANQAVRRLAKYGPALVDAGGDIAISGPTEDGSAWLIEVADPLRLQRNLGLLSIRTGGIATSGIDFRRWMHDGEWKHHIIDPRTNQPAETDLISVTVSAPNCIQAEVAAKVVMIMGSHLGLSWLEDQPGLCGFLVQHDGRILLSKGMEECIRR